MLNAKRALDLNAESSPALPRVPALEALYRKGCTPRQGEVIMVAGRSGTQKSGFALWWVSQMNLPTLYLSADMSAYQASIRLACMVHGMTTEQVERGLGEHREEFLKPLDDLQITFSFGEITWRGLDAEIEAYVELWDAYPQVIVIDNLMDIEGCEADYAAQMDAMQNITALSRMTGATVILLHHASDKSWEAKSDPWSPPSRDQVKGGLSEKPELALAVALDPQSLEFRIAVLKQRMGPCDPTGRNWASFRCEPDRTRFHAWGGHDIYTAADVAQSSTIN